MRGPSLFDAVLSAVRAVEEVPPRGGGTFPAPVSHLRTRHRLWRWSDVAEWAGDAKPDELHDARVIAA